jgi:anti-sigma-K factor RskA
MATEHTPAIEELLSVYALGALDGEDLRAVEEHLAGGCSECAPRLADLADEVEELAAAAPPVAPSDTVRARLMRELGEPIAASTAIRSPASRPRRVPAWSWLAAAAAMLLLLVWGLATRGALTSEVAGLRAELSRARADRDRATARATGLAAELASAEADNERLAQAMAIISAPAMKPVALAGLKDAPGARGHAFVDPAAKRAVFVAANLPPLAPGKTYELWFIAAGKPVAAGTFAVGPKGSATVPVANALPDIAQIQAWAVTIEPQGGVPQPTGPMVLKG